MMKSSVAVLAVFFTVGILWANIPQPRTKESKADPYLKQRERMVATQIDWRSVKDGRIGVRDEVVLDAMRRVPRHEFVPRRYKSRAYADSPLPIGYDQTISQPYIVGFMTEMLKVKKEHKVLEIGTGSGYQAAVLAEIVDDVYSIEIIKELGEQVKARLERLNYQNITVRIDDGYFGWEEHAPFDAIIVTAAADHIPPPLVRQLKPGGRMGIPVGGRFQVQNLLMVEKALDGTVTTKQVMPVRFVPLTRSQKKDKKNK